MTIQEGSERLAKAILLPINPALIIILGGFTVLWGFWVLNPWSSVFAKEPQVYSLLAQLAPEIFWGCLAIVCGLITAHGAVRRQYPSLARGAVTSFFHWFIIAIFLFIGDVASTGGLTAFLFAVYSAVVALNIRINFKDNPEILH